MKPLDLPEIPLPKSWDENVKRGLLAAFTLAHYTVVNIRAWGHAAEQPPLKHELHIERLEHHSALLREQLRIITGRAARSKSLPHYTAHSRFAILGVQQARGWSNARTARDFLISPVTVASWHRKLDDDALLEPPGGPVNKFPDFVTTVVQQLKTLFPLLGYRQIAGWLARAGLHLSAATIRRMLDRPVQAPQLPKDVPFPPDKSPEPTRTVVSKYPGHVFNCDITTIPTCWGLAISWWPTGFPALFPFCWKVIAVIDAYSRKVLAFRVCRKEPSAEDVVATLDAAVECAGRAPRHLITDKGTQFYSTKRKKPSMTLQAWLDRCGVKPRFGAVGKKGSIALIERFFRTLKQEGIRRILVPYELDWIRAELSAFIDWYNGKRPHSALNCATPDEVFREVDPPKDQPRYEVRSRYPVSTEDIDSGYVWRVKHVELDADCFRRRRHLPDVSLDVAA